jgi:thymidylate synthase (FAD)
MKNENTVELIGYYGSDLTHAGSAWTSTSREGKLEDPEKVRKLLFMLAENQHKTPFEKSVLHFLVTSDLCSHIHTIKHRIGVSVNTESARYKELKDDKFYLPNDWDEEERQKLEGFTNDALKTYHEALERLVKKGYDRKRAKESARFYLPYCTQLTQDVSFNFSSFVHFQKLRNSPDAQKEIREIAQKMLDLVKGTHQFDMSIAAWGLN